MPTAGEEGYEKPVICPYDKAHEIRQGRMQVHLYKCRLEHQNKTGPWVQCPFNSTHTIPKVEIEYHTEEECLNHADWYRYTHQVGDSNCPVKDLVPVNAATVPDGGENWDDFESQGSVLSTLKEEASKKKIFRMMQCQSKSKRKEFRNQEKLRHSALEHMNYEEVSTASNNAPLRRPMKQSSIPITRQDPEEAVAEITKQFRSFDMQMKTKSAASDTSSVYNEPPSTTHSVYEAPVEEELVAPSCSQSSISYASSLSRPSTSMSLALSSKNRSRPSTASNIEENSKKSQARKDDNFQIKIPGLGRGARRKM